jgi:hypothetical protein
MAAQIRERQRRGFDMGDEATARLGQRRGAVGMTLLVSAFMAWCGRVRDAARRGRVAAMRRQGADRRARRGKRRLTGGPLMSVIFELNLLPEENSSEQIARN